MTMTDQELLATARDMRTLILSRTKKKGKPVIKVARLFQQDNFTTVVLNNSYAGMSKCNPVDTNDSGVGVSIALRRAMTQLLNV